MSENYKKFNLELDKASTEIKGVLVSSQELATTDTVILKQQTPQKNVLEIKWNVTGKTGAVTAQGIEIEAGLDDNHIDRLLFVLNAVRDSARQLQRLEILGVDNDYLARTAFQVFQACTTITTLIVKSTCGAGVLGSEGACSSLADWLGNGDCKLLSVHVETCDNVPEESLVSMFESLRSNTSVVKFVLDGDNHERVYELVGAAIARVIDENHTLTTFQTTIPFGSCATITDIARLLGSNSTLSSFGLELLYRSEEESPIADAIKTNECLRRFKLDIYTGINRLMESDDYEPGVTEVPEDFDEVGFTDCLEEAMKINKTLHGIDVNFEEHEMFTQMPLGDAIDYQLKLNQYGGRKYVTKPQFPTNLWPEVLGRAAKASLYRVHYIGAVEGVREEIYPHTLNALYVLVCTKPDIFQDAK